MNTVTWLRADTLADVIDKALDGPRIGNISPVAIHEFEKEDVDAD